jgi:hypothetical protein
MAVVHKLLNQRVPSFGSLRTHQRIDGPARAHGDGTGLSSARTCLCALLAARFQLHDNRSRSCA